MGRRAGVLLGCGAVVLILVGVALYDGYRGRPAPGTQDMVPRAGLADAPQSHSRVSPHALYVGAMGGGSVVVSPDAKGDVFTVIGAPALFDYAESATVQLVATPDPGHVLDYWVTVGKLNTVAIDRDTATLTAMTVFSGTVVAMFRPEDGHADAGTDFVVAALGPGEVKVEHPSLPADPTRGPVVGTVPAGETVRATALDVDPEEGVFACWEVTRDGVTKYLAERAVDISADTTATAVYYEFVDPRGDMAATVSTRVQGEGTINIGSGRFHFSAYAMRGNPASGWNVLHLIAAPASGAVFKEWHFAPADERSPHIALSLFSGYEVIAEFTSRPGMASFDLVTDLAEFLVAIGDNDAVAEVWNLEFDTGEVKYERDGPKLLPNGIPDAAELALLQGILQDTTFERAAGGGASHSRLWASYHANLARAESDLMGRPPPVQRLLAAYMTLGTHGHQETVPFYLKRLYGIDFEPVRYEQGGARFFNKRGDVDNDGAWNVEEWRYAVRANNGVADRAAVERFVAIAMDRSIRGK